jgi:hypothetical protein
MPKKEDDPTFSVIPIDHIGHAAPCIETAFFRDMGQPAPHPLRGAALATRVSC